MEYGLWQGLERATGNMASTALNLAQLQNQSRHMRALEADSAARIRMAEEQASREKTAFENSEKKRMEQEKIDNAFVPVSTVAPDLMKMPRLKQQMIEAAQAAGYKTEETSDEIYVPNKAIKYIGRLMTTKSEFKKITLQNAYDDLTEQSATIGKQIAELQTTGKPDEKKLIPLVRQQQAVKQQIAGIIGAREDIQAEIAKKSKYQNVQLPSGQWVAQDTATGDIVPLKGTPESVVKRTMQETAAVNGKVPIGYRYTENGELEAIPGGPADFKKQEQIQKQTSAVNSISSELDRLASVANQLKNHPGLNGITGIRGTIPNIPGSQAANAEALLETLKSQTAFSVLQTMRNNSKTGGALGQVSDKEGQLLQNNLAALDKAQSADAYKKALQQIIDYTEKSKNRIQNSVSNQQVRNVPQITPPRAAIETLKRNPSTANQFDEIFGQGASKKYIGGK